MTQQAHNVIKPTMEGSLGLDQECKVWEKTDRSPVQLNKNGSIPSVPGFYTPWLLAIAR